MKHSLFSLSFLFLLFSYPILSTSQGASPFYDVGERTALYQVANLYALAATNFEKGCDNGKSRSEADSELREYLAELYPDESEKRDWIIQGFNTLFEQEISRYNYNPSAKNCLRAAVVAENRITRAKQRAKRKVTHKLPTTTARPTAVTQEDALPTGKFTGAIPTFDCAGKLNNHFLGLPKTYAMTDVYSSLCSGKDTRYYYDEMQALIGKYATNQAIKIATSKFNYTYGNSEISAKRFDCSALKNFVFTQNGELLADQVRAGFLCWAEQEVNKEIRLKEKLKRKNEAAEKHAALPLSTRMAQYEKESEVFQAKCESDSTYAKFHDCTCQAKKFVEYRLQHGIEHPVSAVFSELHSMQWKQCIDNDSAREQLTVQCGEMLSMPFMQSTLPQSEVVNVCGCYSERVLGDAMQSKIKTDPFTSRPSIRRLGKQSLRDCLAKHHNNK